MTIHRAIFSNVMFQVLLSGWQFKPTLAKLSTYKITKYVYFKPNAIKALLDYKTHFRCIHVPYLKLTLDSCFQCLRSEVTGITSRNHYYNIHFVIMMTAKMYFRTFQESHNDCCVYTIPFWSVCCPFPSLCFPTTASFF